MKAFFLGLLATVVAVILCFGCYQGYWYLAKHNVQHQYDVNTGTQQYQAGLIQQERDLANGYQAAQDSAQKAFISRQFCTMLKDVQPVPNDLADDAILLNCN